LILFGEKYDEEKFKSVLSVTGLSKDVKEFGNNVETEIGERGVNLSGG